MIPSLIYLIVILLIVGVLYWGVMQIPLPPPFPKVIQIVFVLILVLILVNFLLGFAGGGLGRPLFYR